MITRSRGSGLVAALTFDDGPNGATTERLLDFLAAKGILATFCVIGESITAEGGPEVLRRTVREGHVLCNHSTSFTDMGEWAADAIETDLRENLRIIRDALGDPAFEVPYFRAPNGNWGRSAEVAERLGMRSLAVINTIDDWTTQDPAALIAHLRAAIRPGEIVLAHDGGGHREATVDAVIAVVTERLAEGWQFSLPADE